MSTTDSSAPDDPTSHDRPGNPGGSAGSHDTSRSGSGDISRSGGGTSGGTSSGTSSGVSPGTGVGPGGTGGTGGTGRTGRVGGGGGGSGERKVGVGELRITRGIGRVLAAALARVTVTGSVPEGPALLAVNHTALVDGPLLYGLLPRPVAFLVKAEVFRGPLGTLLTHTGQIPVRRDTVESAPLKAALDVLGAGGIVGVFPEGTRGEGDVTQVRHGIAYLAVRSGAAVVPVAVHGPRQRRGRAILVPHRPPVRVAFGEPLRLSRGPASRRTVAAAASEIHRTLAAHVAATRPEPERDQP
ncbi:MAG TPA: lysophospholipid acyltransferase family protein [Mycobacteriales bacterium]|nr:lysophospholipid acyltransferase family protein [Mycobacteriales bacterium]